LEGWLEKKGKVFWNMRYFHLTGNVLRYFEKALLANGPQKPKQDLEPHAVIELEGCQIELESGILTVKTGSGGGMLGSPSFRMKHRDPTAIQEWHTTIKLSQEIWEEGKALGNRYRD